MDSKEIGQLLEKYWNCETSLEEEQALRSYFNGPDVPEQLKEAAELFRFFEKERLRSLNENFDKEVLRSVKKVERGAKVVSMVRWVQVARIAAGILVVVIAGYFINKEFVQSQEKFAVEDTFTTPEDALAETKKALMMISKSFGKAKQSASKINLLNEAEEKISGKNKANKKSDSDKTSI